MATVGEAIRKLRIVQTYETPGAEEATRRSRDFAAAQREIASTSVSVEKSSLTVASVYQRVAAEAERLRRASGSAARDAAAAGGRSAGASLEVAARQAAVAIQSTAPVIGVVTREATQSAGILARAFAPSLAVVSREAATTAAVVGRELSPAMSIVAREALTTAGVLGRDMAPALGMVARQLAPLALAAGPLVLFGAGILYTAHTAREAIAAYRRYEDRLVEINNVIAMTGSASGKTSAGILRLADAIGNINESRQAAQSLLTFRDIAGETFDQTLRAANDLAASGFGSVASAAKVMGQALEDPRQGLSALEQAGLRFAPVQKTVWQDMVETGRRAQAQREILRSVAEQIGGAGAARAASVSGAWTELSDAMQRGSEQWGASIANTIRLADALGTLAKAVNWLNSLVPPAGIDPEVVQQYQKYAIRRQGLTPGAVFGNHLEKVQVTPVFTADQAYEKVGRMWDQDKAQKERIDGVIDALERERRALKLTETQREIDKRLREAQVDAASKEGQRIIERTTLLLGEKEAIEARKKAEEEAAAQRKRDEEFMRRTAEQRQTAIDKLLQEREALFMTAEAARAAAIAQAELAKYRERGTAVSDSLRRDIDSWSRQVAEIERVNRSISDVKAATTDFAISFTRDLRRGASATEAFANSLDRLTDRLLDGVLKSAIDGLFGSLGQGGAQGWLTSLIRMSGIANENGNVFASGRLVPFAAGGVVASPTIFPMANGMGLMGEAGPEAIMPLRRAPDGRLGVEAQGNRAAAPIVNVNVTNAAGADVSVGQAQRNADGSISLDVLVDRAVARRIASGRSETAKAAGLKPRMRG